MQHILVLIIPPHADAGLLFDGDRQHIAVVIIGVFAQKVDAARRLRRYLGRAPKRCLEAAIVLPGVFRATP